MAACYASPFSRTLETAQLALAAAGLEDVQVQEHASLRERYFGVDLELQSHDGYCPAWRDDEADSSSRPGGDGESVSEVSCRLRALLSELEARHRGCHVLLVSHGDTLSILRATALETPLGEHRRYGMATAELVRLLPSPACSAS